MELYKKYMSIVKELYINDKISFREYRLIYCILSDLYVDVDGLRNPDELNEYLSVSDIDYFSKQERFDRKQILQAIESSSLEDEVIRKIKEHILEE